MQRFADLYTRLDATTKTNEKLAALREFFSAAAPADAAWALYFLSGRKPKQVVPTRKLVDWAAGAAEVPLWLFDECYDSVGDLAETIALLLPAAPGSTERPLHEWVERGLLPLRGSDEGEQARAMREAWAEMNPHQRFLWNKLITGAFRIGVSQRLVTRAIAEVAGLDVAVIAHRLMGSWEPSAEFYRGLVAPEAGEADESRPYPFLLAHPLEAEPESLGEVGDWHAEWKWDGIRAQLIRRGGMTYLWSRGEELITDRFPELHDDAGRLAEGTVLDGEIVAWKEGRVLPFAELQRRIGRKTLGKRILADVPVVFLAFDLLEREGGDIRQEPLRVRRDELRRSLEGLPAGARIQLAEVVTASSWEELAAARERSREQNVEGLMLKRLEAPYAVGRPRGVWWKWKIEPHSVDAVLIYAQRGSGRRATLYTDYTFGVWHNGELVPFAKAYSGLSDAEIREVDSFVRRNTLEKFGPVCRVKPELVFELGFENIQRSTRHKSGVAVRFPRMLRWRTDKTPEEAETLEGLRALIR